MIFMADCVVRSDTPSPISAERVSRIPPPDDDAHEDGLFVHELTVVNNLLGRYVIRYLDVDAGRAEPITTDEERTLAARVAAVWRSPYEPEQPAETAAAAHGTFATTAPTRTHSTESTRERHAPSTGRRRGAGSP